MNNIVQLVIFVLFCIDATIASSFVVRFTMEKKPKSSITPYVYALLISSVVWSIGMGFMSLQENDQYAYYFRVFGILGTFVFMMSIQFILTALSELPRKTAIVINGISCLGLPIFFAYIQPGQTVFIHNEIGTTFYFKQNLITIIYSIYFVVVSINIFVVTLYTVIHHKLKLVVSAAKRFLIIESLIFLGAITDMIMPSMGFAAFPGSAITHFWGVFVLWLAIHEMYRSQITIANMSEYVYHSLTTPVLIFNSDYKVEIINTASEEFFKQQERSLVTYGTKITELFDVDENFFDFSGRNCTKKAICYATGSNCEIGISKINDSYGDIIGYICLINDLTEHEMIIKRLEQARQDADAANLSKSLFLTNMSHEIRTPMNAILGFSELALSEEIDDTSRGYFSEINQAGDVLLSVINEILNISKIEAGKVEVASEEYSPEIIIRDVELITRANADKKDLSFNVNIDKTFPSLLKGDKNKIREILLNLLGNAVKYTHSGSVSLDVGATISNDVATVEFTIKDTGIGIKEEDLPLIFDKFSRVDAKLNSKTEGTGLGLSITKGLINLMKGTIDVESEYGKGTTFKVTIPQLVLDSTPISQSHIDKVIVKEQQAYIDLSGKQFLVVDDNKVNLKVSSSFLKKYGASIDSCLSGAEAINMCQEKLYDIVFMDHMMPEMDGVEAMKLIRKIEGYQEGAPSKIVVLTANAVNEAREMLLSEGFDGFISKPMSKSELDEVILKVIS